MSILHVVGAKIWGGGEQYVYDMCDELHNRQISSFVLIDKHNTEFQQRFAAVSHVVTGDLYTIKGFTSVLTIAEYIKRNGITVIQCHSGKYILFCIALKKLTGAKLLFYKHNIIPAKTDIYHRWIQSQVDAFICVSQRVYNAQLIAQEKQKYHLVYNGINIRRFPKLNNIEKNDIFTVGYAGRITENKGVFELIDAIAELYRRHIPIRCILCGDATSDMHQQLETYIKTRHLHRIVIYKGFQKNMNQFYRSIDCLVAPSKVAEAFGLVLCESMYCGTPVITSRSGAQEEIIEHRISGLLLDSVTAENISRFIELLINNPSVYRELSQNGKARVESKFTIQSMVDSILQIIKQIN